MNLRDVVTLIQLTASANNGAMPKSISVSHEEWLAIRKELIALVEQRDPLTLAPLAADIGRPNFLVLGVPVVVRRDRAA